MSNDSSGSGTSSPYASIRGNSRPVSCCSRRAVASCAGVGSTPTGRAPARASLAEKYAVPQPSSTMSRPATSPSQRSGMPKTPHSSAASFQAAEALESVYSRFVSVHWTTFAATRLEASAELIGGEPERDLALGRLRRVGAVDEVVRHRAREVAANRARLRIGGVRRADRLAHRRDCAFAFHDERPGRARRDELDELAEERLLAVLAVVLLAELAAHGQQLARAHGEAAVLDPLQDLAGEAPPDGIRLDQDECAFDGHCGGHSKDVRIDHVQVAAPPGCEEEARAFYGGVLGLREVEKPEALRARGGVWFALAGGQQLHVGVEQEFAPARKAHPAFAVDDLNAVAEALGEVRWDEELPGVRRFYAKDPFGNRLELVEAS